VHRFVLSQKEGLSSRLGVAALSCSIANVLAFTVNGAALMNYPVNFYIYFDLGIVVGLMLYHEEKNRLERKELAAEDDGPRLRNRSNPYLRNAPPGGMPPRPGARPRPAFHG
jgi:hypothetical protein